MARLLRRKSQLLIAYGACAVSGGIPGLANQFSREQLLHFNYQQAPTVVNQSATRPIPESRPDGSAAAICHLPSAIDAAPGQGRAPTAPVQSPDAPAQGAEPLRLPPLHQLVRSLDQVVEVDFYVPGCPPTPNLTKAALNAVLSGQLPPKGSVLAPDIALCDECPRKKTKPANLSFTEFKRPHQVLADPELCFLAQGLVCLGPATRSGCGALCPLGNMPCTGCFGPTSRVRDQGLKAISSLAASLVPTEEAGISKALENIPDPVGTFYRYGLAKSLLRRKTPAP